MKSHKEMFEALLAGKTLVSKQKTYTPEISLLDNGQLSRTSCKNNLKLLFDLPLAAWKIKQKTININGFEVPEPLFEKPEIGTEYYVPDMNSRNSFVDSFTWVNDPIDKDYFEKGLVHLTEEAAELHAKALLSFTQKE